MNWFREIRGTLWKIIHHPQFELQDLRFGARMLVKRPGFTFLVAGLLALGIGSCTIIFSLFDAVFLKTLPVRRPGELVRMVKPYPMPKVPPQSTFAYPYYEALRDRSTTLAAVFAETGMSWQMAMTDPEPAEYITVDVVTPGYFQDLGARPGRTWTTRRCDSLALDTPPLPVVAYIGHRKQGFATCRGSRSPNGLDNGEQDAETQKRSFLTG